jgi:tRNA-Thr(GGU) m(6)t(6)A37 methyltransferase TsaA
MKTPKPLAPGAPPSEITFTAIGTYRSDAKAPYEAARQPLDRETSLGEITLNSGQQFEQALEDLGGFERIWLVYQFHHNADWKPKVLPPRGSDKKVGVFATRAPYRPNPIGLSCVKLVAVQGIRLTVQGADLLDGTPILDIKPYLPYADAFPNAATGWLGEPAPNTIALDELAEEQLRYLEGQGLNTFRSFLQNQLEFDPLNSAKKRVSPQGDTAVLAYKTWRARFVADETARTVRVKEIFSGYSEEDLAKTEDRYQDKALHRAFCATFAKV